MADDQHVLEIQLYSNMLLLNAALDGGHRIKFLLLSKRRRDLIAKLHRATSYTQPDVASTIKGGPTE